MRLVIDFPYRLRHYANTTGFGWKVKAAYARRLRMNVGMQLLTLGKERPAIPCQVTITRYAPHPFDDDNMVHAGKHVRDEVAAWLGIDDRHNDKVQYLYAQEKSKTYHVKVSIEDSEGNHENTQDAG